MHTIGVESVSHWKSVEIPAICDKTIGNIKTDQFNPKIMEFFSESFDGIQRIKKDNKFKRMLYNQQYGFYCCRNSLQDTLPARNCDSVSNHIHSRRNRIHSMYRN